MASWTFGNFGNEMALSTSGTKRESRQRFEVLPGSSRWFGPPF